MPCPLTTENLAAIRAAKAMCEAMGALMVATEHAADFLLDHAESEDWDGIPIDDARAVAMETIESLFTAANQLGAAHGFSVQFNRLESAYQLRESF